MERGHTPKDMGSLDACTTHEVRQDAGRSLRIKIKNLKLCLLVKCIREQGYIVGCEVFLNPKTMK